MTIVLGDTGFIVIDSLWIAEAARTSIDLAREKLGNRPIMGVVYTHTHVDHYGGIKGIVDEQEARARHVQFWRRADLWTRTPRPVRERESLVAKGNETTPTGPARK